MNTDENRYQCLSGFICGSLSAMLERPALSDEMIAGALLAHHAITASEIRFLPIGNDVNSFAFKVIATDGAAYFLKARRGVMNLPALTIPRFVQAHGVPAVAPIASLAGALWVDARDFHLILYPFIEGENGMDVGLSDSQWIAFGTALRRMHNLLLPPEMKHLLPVEDFSAYPYFQDVLQRVDALVHTIHFQDETLRDLAAFWRSHAGEIKHITQRARELGNALKSTAWRGMLCHADIHTANVMVDHAGGIHFVDWDQPLFAPKERDLTFVMGEKEALFFQGYGVVKIDWQAMAYYRHWWMVQDLGDYAERAFLMPEMSDDVREDAAAGIKGLFNAGDVIDTVLKS
jgi:spectinomycin phosphotransferase